MSLTISNETEWNNAAAIYTHDNPFSGTLTITAPITFTAPFSYIALAHGSIADGQNHRIDMGDFCAGLFKLPEGERDTTITNITMDGNQYNSASILGFLLHYCESSCKQTGNISNIKVMNRKR